MHDDQEARPARAARAPRLEKAPSGTGAVRHARQQAVLPWLMFCDLSSACKVGLIARQALSAEDGQRLTGLASHTACASASFLRSRLGLEASLTRAGYIKDKRAAASATCWSFCSSLYPLGPAPTKTNNDVGLYRGRQHEFTLPHPRPGHWAHSAFAAFAVWFWPSGADVRATYGRSASRRASYR